ncbi:M15 family metallopeptidase [Sporosarcina sp. E16_8]|uniref:M15 family metallopeptidase n=1 Tax=Sporosarcina sp. E16_8 TaxID=2789295 RepID=UPI001A91E6DB|nr:M15 family metallopeptidase [Sporosarcina sp. E16_8]MBO0586100.1 M15 family metallopeptidase [Sporosarcina sp. E16_8]
MNVTSTCRDLNELHPTAQTACRLFLQECEKAGVKVFITETHRPQARQNYLYEQGRSRPGQVVTWTKNSNHMTRLAWDIAVSPPVALYDTATLIKAGAIARKLGITWGGDWVGTVDRPHFEVKPNWKAPAGIVAHDVPIKEDDELKFSSPTLKTETETSLLSKAHRQIIVAAAVKAGAHASWDDKLAYGTITDADVLGLAVKYTVAVNK